MKYPNRLHQGSPNALAIIDPYGRFQVGGPVSINEVMAQMPQGFANTVADVMPGPAQERSYGRMMNSIGQINEQNTPIRNALHAADTALEGGSLLLDAIPYAKAMGIALSSLVPLMMRNGGKIPDLARYAKGMRGTIGSTGAKTADLGALAKAQELKATGASADDIYAQTRWWLDHPDGRPRFEIDDSGAVFTGFSGKKAGITDAVIHDELYKNYPPAKNITIWDNSSPASSVTNAPPTGEYDEANNIIGLGNVYSRDEAKSTTLHELQHGIQSMDKMAKGGASSQFPVMSMDEHELFKEINFDQVAPIMRRYNIAGDDALGPMEFMNRVVKEAQASGAKGSEIGILATERGKIANRIKEITLKETPYEKYRRLAGEAEARLVQNRMNMTMDERLANPFYKNFDVPLEDQIVRMDSGVAQSADSLPMDEASRLARADESFPINAYHGTNKDINTFDPSKKGGATRARSAEKAFWFSDDAETTASGYAGLAGDNEVQKLIDASMDAERRGDWDAAHNLTVQAEELDQVIGKGENVMPVRLGGKMKIVDMDGAKYDPDDINLSAILDEAKAEGFDGVTFNNFSDEAGYGVYNPVTHHAVFDPKNIRSKFAKFDPAKKNSANLLAGGAAAAIGAGALMNRDRKDY